MNARSNLLTNGAEETFRGASVLKVSEAERGTCLPAGMAERGKQFACS